jgi:hypothetical protein
MVFRRSVPLSLHDRCCEQDLQSSMGHLSEDVLMVSASIAA